MNPDGNEKAFNAIKAHGPDAQQAKFNVFGRNNAHNIDLNRNFPDQFKTPEHPVPDTETKLMIDWMEQNYFVLSLNVHGGALVANYPFDDSPAPGRKRRSYSASDDDDVFR
jgi:carboxypeptidase D